MFSEEELRHAAMEANKVIMSTLPEPEECTHEFSPKFERKFRKLVRKTDHPVQYRLRQTAWAALIMLVLFGAFQSLGEDVQAKITGWVYERYENFVHFFYTGSTGSAPVEDADYRPTWIPEGFEESEKYEFPTSKIITYQNGDGKWIRFRYSWDVRDADLFIRDKNMRSKDVKVNDMDAKVYWSVLNDREPFIVWTTPEKTVAFFISGDLTEEVFIKMAESVK